MRFLHAVIVLNTFFFIFLHILLPHLSLPAYIIYICMLVFYLHLLENNRRTAETSFTFAPIFYRELFKKKPLLIIFITRFIYLCTFSEVVDYLYRVYGQTLRDNLQPGTSNS